MEIERLDHIVLTVKNIDQTIHFYQEILGFTLVHFGNGRKALSFGKQKINLHEFGKEFEPKAKAPTPGSADLCFISKTNLLEVREQLLSKNINIIEGIVERTGALGKIQSLYIKDPDENLIEISNYP